MTGSGNPSLETQACSFGLTPLEKSRINIPLTRQSYKEKRVMLPRWSSVLVGVPVAETQQARSQWNPELKIKLDSLLP